MSETSTSATDSTVSTDAPSSSALPSTPAAPTTPAPADTSSPSSGSDSTSPSSGDSHASDREGLLAAVRQVVQPKPETPAVPSEDADAEPQTEAAQDEVAAEAPEPPATEAPQADSSEEELADPTEGDLRKLRPETRKRVQQLLAQRNEARQQLQAVQPELTEYRQLRGYLEQSQLAPDDFNTMLASGAALRRQDFQTYLDITWPFTQIALEATGRRIASDIQKQVDDGTISEAAARELTQMRLRATQAEHRYTQQTQQVTTAAQNQNLQGIRTAVDAWENDILARDPDYALHKRDAVRRYSQALMQERGPPRTPQEGVDLVKAAYDEVQRMMGVLRPQVKPTRPTPSGIQVATNGPVAEPKTMKEAALRALEGMRRAS